MSLVNEGLPIARFIIAFLMESHPIHDMDHPGRPQQSAIRIDHGRRVVRTFAVSFEDIQDHHDAQLSRSLCESSGRRSRNGLCQSQGLRRRRHLRVEGLEGQLGEAQQLGSLPRRRLQGSQTALAVGLAIGSRSLLNQGDSQLSTSEKTGSTRAG